MDLISLVSAVPRVALFLLIIVGGAIIAELFYFRRKQLPKEVDFRRKEVPLPNPPAYEPPPSANLPNTPPAQEGPPPAPSITPPVTPVVDNLSVTPMPTPQAGFTTEVVSPKKSPLSKKTLTTLLLILLVAVSIPAAIFLVRQRQELRKQAYPGQKCTTKDDCNGLYEECINGQCVDTNVVTRCGDSVCNGSETCSSCPGDCGSCGQCLPNGAVCNGPGQTNESCCSVICNFGTCRGNTPAEGCGGLDEPTCWTHGVYCYWDNGSCVPKTGTPTPGTGNVTCSAGKGSVSAQNNTNQTITGSYFLASCGGDSCFCSGASTSISIAPHSGFSRSISVGCGSWQSDINVQGCSAGDNGCNECGTPPGSGTPTPTPSIPGFSAQCIATKTLNSNFVVITNLSTLQVGQTVFFATHGSTNEPGGITMARFKINGTADASWCNGSGNTIVGGWCQTTNMHGADFIVQFTIPNNGPFNVQSMVLNPTLGWH